MGFEPSTTRMRKPPDLRHLAVIMDGNRRWAADRGLSVEEGYQAGVGAARRLIDSCFEMGLEHLTLFALSHDNRHRPSEHLVGLFDVLLASGHALLEEVLVSRGIELRALGERGDLPPLVAEGLAYGCQSTRGGGGMVVHLALGYSGRREIRAACRRLLEEGRRGEVSDERFRAALDTADRPDPDLLIRTGGERRISDFLLYELAYTELWFTPVWWPDFGHVELSEAMNDFARRHRTFGRGRVSAE